MKRVLVTGGGGFVGSNLIERLIARGDEVWALLHPRTIAWRLKRWNAAIRVCRADVSDEVGVSQVVAECKPDWVFHLAADGNSSWQRDQKRMVSTNIQGTINVMIACLRSAVGAFIYTGSSSEYGFKDHATNEQDTLEPNSYYALTKAFSTQYVSFEGRKDKKPVVSLRLYSVYGPYEEPKRLIPTLITHGMHGKLPPLASPNIARDFVFIDDVVDALILAAEQAQMFGGEVFNVGSGEQTSLRDAVRIVTEQFQLQMHPQWESMENRIWDSEVWVSDISKIKNALGWFPQTSFRNGLQLTTEWLKGDPAMLDYYEREIFGNTIRA